MITRRIEYGSTNNLGSTSIEVSFDESKKILIMKEISLNGGLSLTNSIEQAIMITFKEIVYPHRKMSRLTDGWTVLQDCDDEGIFKIEYDMLSRTGMTTNGGGLFEKYTIANPKWIRYSKDRRSFDLLYKRIN